MQEFSLLSEFCICLYVMSVTSVGWCVCTSAANKCLLKVAQYAAQVEHYEKAIDIYEQVNRLAYTFSLTALVVQAEHSV